MGLQRWKKEQGVRLPLCVSHAMAMAEQEVVALRGRRERRKESTTCKDMCIYYTELAPAHGSRLTAHGSWLMANG